MSKGKRFTNQELEYIKVHSQDMTISEIAVALGRNYWSVQRVMQNKRGEELTRFQMSEIDRLKDEMSVFRIADKLKIPYASVFGYINKRVNVKQNHTFTPQEDDVIRKMYPIYRARLIATQLGVTEEQIYNRAKRLGLKKNRTSS